MTVDHLDPFKLSVKEILEVVARIGRETVKRTQREAFRPMPAERVQDADRLPTDSPASEVLDCIASLGTAYDVPARREVRQRQSPHGELQAPIDYKAHKWVTKRVKKLLGDHITAIAGEEANQKEWQEFLGMKAGQLGLLIDPLDGTANQRVLRSAFSCNTGLYRALGQGEFELLGYSVTTSAGETQVNDLTNVTMISRSWERIVVTDEEPRESQFPWALSISGARPKVRHEFAALFRSDLRLDLPIRTYAGIDSPDPALDVYTVAGAPIVATFPITELEYCITPHPQAPYDAFPLLGAVMSGHQYYRLDTSQELPSDRLRSLLSVVTGPVGARPKPVPAGLLVRFGASQQTTQRLLDELRRPVVSGV